MRNGAVTDAGFGRQPPVKTASRLEIFRLDKLFPGEPADRVRVHVRRNRRDPTAPECGPRSFRFGPQRPANKILRKLSGVSAPAGAPYVERLDARTGAGLASLDHAQPDRGGPADRSGVASRRTTSFRRLSAAFRASYAEPSTDVHRAGLELLAAADGRRPDQVRAGVLLAIPKRPVTAQGGTEGGDGGGGCGTTAAESSAK